MTDIGLSDVLSILQPKNWPYHMNQLKVIDQLFELLDSTDDTTRYGAFKELMSTTEKEVPWIYDKWHLLVDKLSSENSYQRSIGVMLMANLAKSDMENRMVSILDRYLELFEDEKFITSRQCLQHVWKIAVSKRTCRDKIIKQLEYAYTQNNYLQRHPKLIKEDIISSLFQIYIHSDDESILSLIHNLIESESDDKLSKVLLKIAKR
jgi:hypothetical protein